MSSDTPIHVHRGERILAFMVAAAVGMSILAFVAIIVATAVGKKDFDDGVWPVIIVLPSIGLPLGLVLIIVLLAISAVRRSRESRDAAQ